jgi:hypothetical protein
MLLDFDPRELLEGSFKKTGKNPLTPWSPWSWAIEPVRGCNLRCGHCATRLFNGPALFMSEDVWVSLFETIRKVSPKTRVEMANAGEPTLHPDLIKFISVARKLSPDSQLQVTTNGTMIASGEMSYRELFDAGLNIVYVDMYAPRETHIALAEKSGFQYYEYLRKPQNMPGAWTYTGPELKLIVLMEHPGHWPKSRKSLGRLGTFYNHLDWEAAKPFGLIPVMIPPNRGCTQPFRYVSVHMDGSYELCCQDFMGETAGKLGNVGDGPDGFLKFWFGEFMQDARRKLRCRCRKEVPYCARCSITFSRSDLVMWKDAGSLDYWWNGEKWVRMPFWRLPKILIKLQDERRGFDFNF